MSVIEQPKPHASLWGRLTRSRGEVEAQELQKQVREAQDPDLTAIDACTPGDTVTIRGMVRSVTLQPRNTNPALEIDLYDGSGSVSVVWLGRREIPGIEPGRTMVVCGRLTCNTENPTIFNPKYELKPSAE
ncbi:MAG: DNA-binding protein [Actinomycetales bacterium]|nr:DNA-binding protein [Actinomycetales bacterium]